MFVVCEKWMETRTDCYIDPGSSLDHSSTSFASWLASLNRGSLRAQSPKSAAGSHFDILSPTASNRPGIWLYYFLMSTCFRLFTPVHLLIDGSTEGQYITIIFGFGIGANILSHEHYEIIAKLLPQSSNYISIIHPRRSSVMQLSSSPISGYFCIISAPTETPAWL